MMWIEMRNESAEQHLPIFDLRVPVKGFFDTSKSVFLATQQKVGG